MVTPSQSALLFKCRVSWTSKHMAAHLKCHVLHMYSHLEMDQHMGAHLKCHVLRLHARDHVRLEVFVELIGLR